jgi:4-hydroxybenzoate polyprenyltransferase
MIKFSHSVFALPFAFLAILLALFDSGTARPGALKIVLWLLCMVSARAFAMTFNRIADLEFDRLNPRTAGRELPRVKITSHQAYTFLFAAAIVFLICAYLFYPLYGNFRPAIFAVPLLVFLAAYSYAKRFTILSHFWLGACLGLAPLATYIVFMPVSGEWISVQVTAIGLAVMFWTAGFDIIYSLADIDFDRTHNLHSIAARLGIRKALMISAACHFLTVLLLGSLMFTNGFGIFYRFAVALGCLLLVFEHLLVRHDLKYVNAAFFTVNGFFSIIFAALAALDLWPKIGL